MPTSTARSRFALSLTDARTGFWLDPEAANASALAAAAGPKTADITLLSNTSWPAGSRPTGPMVRINTSRGPVTAVVADQALMSGGPDPVATNGPIQLRQRLAAETALLALDTGGSANPVPVSVAVVPGRTYPIVVRGRCTALIRGP